MYFLNLTFPEFLAIFGVASSLITALYLLDRTGRKRVVSTLRFWPAISSATVQQTRKRVREPWSLLLQLLSLLLLLLSLAQLEWGSRGRSGRDHVMLLDTSAWTAERWGSRGHALLDEEKRIARQYIANLPNHDRLLLVRVDALATPAGSFTSDRETINSELNGLLPSYGALNLTNAFAFARQAQALAGISPGVNQGVNQGEVVYIGPGMMAAEPETLTPPANLRTIIVSPDLRNCGIQQIGVRRSEEDLRSWEATVTVHNYGADTRSVRLRTAFAGTAFAPRNLTVGGGSNATAEFSFSAARAGELTARIQDSDVLTTDNNVSLQVPGSGTLRLAVVTGRRDLLRPLLESNHQVSASFYDDIPSLRASVNQSGVRNLSADVVLFDRVAPSSEILPPTLEVPSVWIAPPAKRSPFAVRTAVGNEAIKSWASSSALAEGLHARETKLGPAQVMETLAGDIAVGIVAEGPVVVARPAQNGKPSVVAIGFDPFEGPIRYDVTTPLLLANTLKWLGPESARTAEIAATQIGSAVIPLDEAAETVSANADAENSKAIRVSNMSGVALPYTAYQHNLQMFVTEPQVVRILEGQHERIVSLTLPNLGTEQWTPKTTAVGIPLKSTLRERMPVDLWRWLALLGGIGLLLEWLMFGPLLRKPKLMSRVGGGRPTSIESEVDKKPDLVLK